MLNDTLKNVHVLQRIDRAEQNARKEPGKREWPTSYRRPGIEILCEELAKSHPKKSYNWVVNEAKQRYLTWSKNRGK